MSEVVVVKVEETKFNSEVKEGMLTQRFLWVDDYSSKVVNGFIIGLAEWLSTFKEKDGKVAIEVRDDKNNFRFAAAVSYIPGEAEEDPGNFALEATFKEEDVADCTRSVSYTHRSFKGLMNDMMGSYYSLAIGDPETVTVSVQVAFDVIEKYLREKSTDLKVGDQMKLVFDYGSFIVTIQDDGLDFNFEFDELMKQRVKSDVDIQK